VSWRKPPVNAHHGGPAGRREATGAAPRDRGGDVEASGPLREAEVRLVTQLSAEEASSFCEWRGNERACRSVGGGKHVSANSSAKSPREKAEETRRCPRRLVWAVGVSQGWTETRVRARVESLGNGVGARAWIASSSRSSGPNDWYSVDAHTSTADACVIR